MKTLTRIFAGLALLGAAASCQLYQIDTQMTPEKAAASIRMECSAVDVYNLPAQSPDPISFNVSSNTPWTIILSSGADWLTVSPASSAASQLIADVVVTAKDNAGDDRSATLTLKGENVAQTKVITIKQARAGKLFVTPMTDEYSAAGGPLTFRIQTNMAWEIHSSAAWLTFNRESGEPDPEGRSFSIIATAAPSNVLERSATVTVIAGDDEESFDVIQKGVFDLTAVGRTFDSNGDSDFILLRTDLPWTVMADKGWIEFLDHDGTGDGSLDQIGFTVLPNEGAARKANITVSAGGVDKTFEVSQNGYLFEIVAPASNELPSTGGDLVLEVKSSISWTPGSEVDGWEVETVDATHFKVKAAFNDIFVAKTGKVFISATDGTKAEVELTQDINFTFDGHTEILEDGSVKVYEDVKSVVKTKAAYQYAIMDADVEMHLGDKGTFMMITSNSGYEYELEINIPRPKYRVRRAGEKTGPSSDAKDFSFSKDQANAMTHAQVKFLPGDTGKINLSFFYNGSQLGETLIGTSAYAEGADVKGNYCIQTIPGDGGAYLNTDSYFIIKSCTVTPVTE